MLDQTNEQARGFINDLLGAPKSPITPEAPKVEAAKIETPAAEAPKTEAAETPAAEAPKVEAPKTEAPKKERRKKEAEAPIDYERLAAATTEAATRAAIESIKQAPKAAAEAEIELPAAEQRRLTYLNRLEKLYPGKYDGVSARYEKAFKEIERYQRKWELENPDETFDPESGAHSSFMEKHSVDWEDDDYTEAVAEEKSEFVRRQTIADYEARDRRRTAEPLAQEKARKVSKDLVNDLDEAFKDLDPFAKDAEAKAEDLDPIKGPVILKAALFADQFITASNRLFDGVDKFDAHNPLHQKVNEFANQKEIAIQRLPHDQQLDSEGRSFVPADRFYSLPAKDRAKSWTLTAEDVAFLARQEIVADAKKAIEREETRANKLRQRWGVEGGKAPTAEKAKAPEAPTPERAKPVSPTGGTEPKMAGVQGTPTSESAVRMSAFRNALMGVK